MNYADKVMQAVAYLQDRMKGVPHVCVELSSGLSGFTAHVEDALVIPYSSVPHWPTTSVIGHEGKIVWGTVGGRSVAVLSGRAHGYEGYSMEEITFPVRVLGVMGCRIYIGTNSSGGMHHTIRGGDIVLLEDHINLTGKNPLTGPNNDAWGPRFPDMTEAYDREFLNRLEVIGRRHGIHLRRGVYVGLNGPSFETPAEIRAFASLGAHVVGMSTVPQVIVARHMDMRVAVLSCAANAAAGLTGGKPLNYADVVEQMAKSSEKMNLIMREFIGEI